MRQCATRAKLGKILHEVEGKLDSFLDKLPVVGGVRYPCLLLSFLNKNDLIKKDHVEKLQEYFVEQTKKRTIFGRVTDSNAILLKTSFDQLELEGHSIFIAKTYANFFKSFRHVLRPETFKQFLQFAVDDESTNKYLSSPFLNYLNLLGLELRSDYRATIDESSGLLSLTQKSSNTKIDILPISEFHASDLNFLKDFIAKNPTKYQKIVALGDQSILSGRRKLKSQTIFQAKKSTGFLEEYHLNDENIEDIREHLMDLQEAQINEASLIATKAGDLDFVGTLVMFLAELDEFPETLLLEVSQHELFQELSVGAETRKLVDQLVENSFLDNFLRTFIFYSETECKTGKNFSCKGPAAYPVTLLARDSDAYKTLMAGKAKRIGERLKQAIEEQPGERLLVLLGRDEFIDVFSHTFCTNGTFQPLAHPQDLDDSDLDCFWQTYAKLYSTLCSKNFRKFVGSPKELTTPAMQDFLKQTDSGWLNLLGKDARQTEKNRCFFVKQALIDE